MAEIITEGSGQLIGGIGNGIVIGGLIFIGLLIIGFIGWFVWYNKQYKYKVLVKQLIKDGKTHRYTDRARIWRDESGTINMRMKTSKKVIKPRGIKDMSRFDGGTYIELVQLDFDNYAPEIGVNIVLKDVIENAAKKEALLGKLLELNVDKKDLPKDELLKVMSEKEAYFRELLEKNIDDISETEQSLIQTAFKKVKPEDLYMFVTNASLDDLQAKYYVEPEDNRFWDSMKKKEAAMKYLQGGISKFLPIILFAIFILGAIIGNYIWIKEATKAVQSGQAIQAESNALQSEANLMMAQALMYLNGSDSNSVVPQTIRG